MVTIPTIILTISGKKSINCTVIPPLPITADLSVSKSTVTPYTSLITAATIACIGFPPVPAPAFCPEIA